MKVNRFTTRILSPYAMGRIMYFFGKEYKKDPMLCQTEFALVLDAAYLL